MNELDQKLREILMGTANDYADSINPELDGTLYTGPNLDKAVEQIKSAFQEAGWQSEQAWFDRFERELSKHDGYVSAAMGRRVRDAAKRAAGLED